MSSVFFSDNPKKRKTQKTILWSIAGGSFFLILLVGFGFLIQFLWNITMAEIFGLPTISYWQAIGLFILAKFFFGFGIGGSNSSGSKSKKKKSDEADGSADELPDFAADESFQKFWQDEGREAWESYQGEDGDPAPEPS